MTDWLDGLAALRDEPLVLVTVADTKGSTPREVGAKMLVTRDASIGTIGGGHLEYKALEFARESLARGVAAPTTLRRVPLGPSLGQCCGGVAVLLFESLSVPRPSWIGTLTELRGTYRQAVLVSRSEMPADADKLVITADASLGGLGDQHLEADAKSIARALLVAGGGAELRALESARDQSTMLLFEPLRPSDFNVVLFGAGHVGKALVRALGALPCAITWVDSRQEQFPPERPANMTVALSDAPEYEVYDAPPGSYFLVMTHSHALDQAICERILRRRDFHYLGLIGSRAKRRKFEKRLLAQGIPEAMLQRLTCPIGVDGISGKQPCEIAIAVAAQLLQSRERVLSSVSDLSATGV